jgi:hypothetical protein
MGNAEHNKERLELRTYPEEGNMFLPFNRLKFNMVARYHSGSGADSGRHENSIGKGHFARSFETGSFTDNGRINRFNNGNRKEIVYIADKGYSQARRLRSSIASSLSLSARQSARKSSTEPGWSLQLPRRCRQERLPSGTAESDFRFGGGVNVRITGPSGTSRGTSIVSLWLSGISTVWVMVILKT